MTQKVLVSDFHIGLGLAQCATLEELGAETRLLNFSALVHQTLAGVSYSGENERRAISEVKRLVAPSAWIPEPLRELLRKSRRGRKLVAGWRGRRWTPAKTKALFRRLGERVMDEVFGGFDVCLTSFPPSMAHLFLHLAERCGGRLVLNLGHRFNIGIYSRRENEEMMDLLRYLHEHPRHALAAASEYDVQYVRHYLGFEPGRLPLLCSHIDAESSSPSAENAILVGPAHRSAPDFVARLNEQAAKMSGRNKRPPFTFAGIRQLYPRYSFADLARHPAAVILPYSAFSVSMIELYQLGLPFFVPSPEALLRRNWMRDRCLFPIYCSERDYRRMTAGAANADQPSPNSYKAEAQKYWFRFCFFYQAENAVLWDSEEDLLRKLMEMDLAEVRRKMREENQRKREAALRQWRDVIFPETGPGQ